jgi:hypothetical protein
MVVDANEVPVTVSVIVKVGTVVEVVVVVDCVKVMTEILLLVTDIIGM